jgi:capsular polysaccharide biosynthesis protein
VLVTPTPYYDPTYLGVPGVLRDTPGDPFRAIETAGTVIDSPAAVAAAAQRLGAGWDQNRVRAAVTVVPVGGTNTLAIQAEAADTAAANRVANTFAAAALGERRQALQAQALGLIAVLRETLPARNVRIASLRAIADGLDPSFSLLHPAAGPGSVAGPGTRQVLTLAVPAGLILGIAAALLAAGIAERRRGAGQSQPERDLVLASASSELVEKRQAQP